MSATSQVTTFSDLYTDLQNRVRAQTSVTATENIAKRLINTALQDIAMATDFHLPWLERRGILITHSTYTTGTVAITAAARTTVTGTSTAWNTAVTGMGFNNARATGKMTFSGGTDIYGVSTVDSDTQITLESRWIGSALSGASYVYFEDEYALASDFLRLVDLQFFSSAYNIRYIGRDEFRRRYPRPNISGRPKAACLLDLGFSGSTAPIRRVQLFPYPDAVYNIPYTYITNNLAVSTAGTEATALSAADDEPNMPLRLRGGIVLHALASWYRDRGNDTRSREVLGEYQAFMSRMLSDQEIATHRTMRIRPRVSGYVSRASRPYRQLGGRLISINNAFDRLEDRGSE